MADYGAKQTKHGRHSNRELFRHRFWNNSFGVCVGWIVTHTIFYDRYKTLGAGLSVKPAESAAAKAICAISEYPSIE